MPRAKYFGCGRMYICVRVRVEMCVKRVHELVGWSGWKLDPVRKDDERECLTSPEIHTSLTIGPNSLDLLWTQFNVCVIGSLYSVAIALHLPKKKKKKKRDE